MNPEATPSREQARRLVADFVRETCNAARSSHGSFFLDEPAVARLFDELSELLDDPRIAAELVDRALRYIAFFLADCGLHGEAMKAAVGIHEYRARLMHSEGRGATAWATRLIGLSISASWNPTRVASYAVIMYLTLVAGLLASSCIAYPLTGEAAIVADVGRETDDLTPGTYHHFYLAAVTITTLGYGDVRPNLRHWWGVFPGTICTLGAVSGYVLLAAIVAVVMNRSGIHPYARIGDWMRQFENEFLGGAIPLFRWDEE